MIAGIDIDAKGAVAYGDHERRLTELPLAVDDTDALTAAASALYAAGVRVAYIETQLLISGVPHGIRGVATQGARHRAVREAIGRAGIRIVDVDGATWQRAIGVSHRGRANMTRSQRRTDTKRQLRTIVEAITGKQWTNHDAAGIAAYALGMERQRGAGA